ncbi:hypothetical protein COV13_02135 [Candidatus Woesearchaeota archaeon CG10_big_fil_rev_8_21_14_0_10_32_9]|nr:MAG: hypothetical protein COV13_02135 [Candidatus Woesearchaeota archaeon CG10_big_fil_rev_8_21_14_0_10_32_9]
MKPFGGNTGLYALVAFAFAVLSITSPGALALITFITPWFFVVIFIGFFILFILMMFGLKHSDLKAGARSEFRIWPIIFAILILLFGLGNAFGQQTLNQGTGSTGTGTTSTSGTDTSVTTTDNLTVGNNGAPGTPDETATDNFGNNVLNTLVNPQVLGMIVVMLIGAFAMFLLTKSWIDND